MRDALLSARDAARIALIDRRLASIEAGEVTERIQSAVEASVPGVFASPLSSLDSAAGLPPHTTSAPVATRGISEELHLARMTVRSSTVNAKLEEARLGAEEDLRARALREEATQREQERALVLVACAARTRAVRAASKPTMSEATHVPPRSQTPTSSGGGDDGCTATTLQHSRLAPIHLTGSLS